MMKAKRIYRTSKNSWRTLPIKLPIRNDRGRIRMVTFYVKSLRSSSVRIKNFFEGRRDCQVVSLEATRKLRLMASKKTRVPLFFTHRWTRCEYVYGPWAPASRWPNNLWTPAVPSGNLRPSLSVARRPRLAIDIARLSVPAFEHRSSHLRVIAACLLFRETSVSRDIGVSVAANTEQSQSTLFHLDWKTFPLADKEKS